jgi:hypothetical protein
LTAKSLARQAEEWPQRTQGRKKESALDKGRFETRLLPTAQEVGALGLMNGTMKFV